MALGNLILDETGQVMAMRVLSNDANGVNVEANIQTTGTIRGVSETTLWTYNILTRPDGSVQGGGNGIMTTQDGDFISLIGNGSGKAVPPGETTNLRTMLHPHSASPKCTDLNGTAWAGEYDVNADGSAINKCWEWK
tara:strand:+ start:37 stop:447 length:411 start_codon:yes stop_codon:yes gene_type:complete